MAIFSHEIVLPDGQGYRVAERRHVDRFGPGWNGCTVDLGGGPLLAAWQLKEAIENPPDPDEEYDQPPDVRIKPVTAEWLLEQRDVGWLIPKTDGFAAGMWQVLAQIGRGRIETGFDAQGSSAFQLLDEFCFDQQFIAAAFDGFELFGQCSHDEIRQIPGILQCEIPYLHAGEILLSLPGRARWRLKSIC